MTIDITRRSLTATLALAPFASRASQEPFPSRPIRVIVPLAAGSTSDIVARLICDEAAKRLETQIVVENRTGAGTRIAAASVARAAPDGYTILSSGATLPTHKVLFKDLPYDPMRDLRPIILTVDNIFVVVIDPRLPVKTLGEFVEYAKANPGKLNYGSYGKNSVMLSIEAFKERAGFDMTEVPYSGGAELNVALLSGQIHFANNPVTVAKQFIDDGRLRALAVIGPKRLAAIPDVPTVAEAGFPYYANPGWNGFFAPAATPDAVVDRLYQEFSATLNDPGVKEQIDRLGAIVMATPPAQTMARMKEEEQTWVRMANLLKIQPI